MKDAQNKQIRGGSGKLFCMELGVELCLLQVLCFLVRISEKREIGHGFRRSSEILSIWL